MTVLLLDAAELETRRAIAATSLAPLAASLAADLEPLLAGPIHFPAEKALLSREGGRCPRHGVYLEFDPYNPSEHRCPTCGETFRGPLHDRFWIYWYQLWLAERAVHAAVLASLGGDARFEALARAILDGYVERYASYPNTDNVLGPTRLFFSTYLESIWLLQICVATDHLSDRTLASRVLDRIVEPSRAIIREYDEGASNRQVWNDAALLAAARLLGDERATEDAVLGKTGVAAHLAGGLLDDGTWYEGENYHLFAHRGLWYGVTMAERAGVEIPASLLDRFQRGFAAPFATALPDFTLPSRRDSQYAISLRQWRIAEHCELGFARRADDPLLGALQRIYQVDLPRRETGRSTSSADVERNVEASALTRADLGWRALLFARPELPDAEPIPPRSVLLQAQGIAVLRREAGCVYAALDYGHSGGGHGHPDRLNLLLAQGAQRWLDDYGTGSYVDPALHWYRSTLAHNAPLVDGCSQERVHGTLLAFDERGGVGWVSAGADGIAPGVTVVRTVVVMPTYMVDVLEWRADRDVTIDLPLHVDLRLVTVNADPLPGMLGGGSGLEDGFDFVRDSIGIAVPKETIVHGRLWTSRDRLDTWSIVSEPSQWWKAIAPAAPGHGDARFVVARSRATRGAIRTVWSWAGDVREASFDGAIRIVLVDGSVHEHRATADGWDIGLETQGARSSIALRGAVSAIEPTPAVYAVAERPALRIPASGAPVVVQLGEANYRRSELSWIQAGQPVARIELRWTGEALRIAVVVPQSDLAFVASDATNPYDNEPPDVNGDGVQLYVRTRVGNAAWMLTPELASDAVRARRIEAWFAPQPLRAEWHREARGYVMEIELPGGELPDALDVIVNEMPRGRVRRRGQLVMSGAAGEFIYLRGDRHEVDRLIPLRLTDD